LYPAALVTGMCLELLQTLSQNGGLCLDAASSCDKQVLAGATHARAGATHKPSKSAQLVARPRWSIAVHSLLPGAAA